MSCVNCSKFSMNCSSPLRLLPKHRAQMPHSISETLSSSSNTVYKLVRAMLQFSLGRDMYPSHDIFTIHEHVRMVKKMSPSVCGRKGVLEPQRWKIVQGVKNGRIELL